MHLAVVYLGLGELEILLRDMDAAFAQRVHARFRADTCHRVQPTEPCARRSERAGVTNAAGYFLARGPSVTSMDVLCSSLPPSPSRAFVFALSRYKAACAPRIEASGRELYRAFRHKRRTAR